MPSAPDRARGVAWIPQATVFVSSACIMVLELVAGRLVSRHLGSSLYTWTSVIGIVLAGIAAGNWLGGRLADRRPPRPTLAVLFLVAAAGTVGVSVLGHAVGDWVFLWTLPWPLRVGLHVAVVFLAPSVVLGMISPVAAKMALDRGAETGRTIGSVYAWGVLGSLVGTFLTGFWLVAAFGTAAVVWSVGGVLAAMGLAFGAARRGAWTAVALFAAIAAVGAGPWGWAREAGAALGLRETFGEDVVWVDESQYSHIRVVRVPGPPARLDMHLDKLLHSSIVVGRPDDLQYGYERIYAAVTRRLGAGRDSLNTLTIGGGGYVFPRWLERHWPGSRTEVVEIDPAVTQAAVEAFGLPADHDLVVHHADGRAFLRHLVEERRRGERAVPYDVIYLDVFNDYSVPYQLATEECLRQVRELLAPDGAYLMNMIDVWAEGRFLGAMIATMERVFPEVAVLVEGGDVAGNPGFRNTFVLVGSERTFDWEDVRAGYDPSIGLTRLGPARRAELAARVGTRPLTDDWAPVENLLAPVVRSAWREIAATALVTEAVESLQAGDAADAIERAERALRIHSGNVSAKHALADAHLTRGEVAEALPLYEEVVSLRPSDTRARNSLGVALLRAGRRDAAAAQFEAVLRLDPDDRLARRNLRLMREAGAAGDPGR